VSLRSIQHWQSNFNQHGGVIPPRNHLQGRPYFLTADQRHDLFTMLNESPELFLDEIRDWVAVSHDIGLSKFALHYLIRDAGLTYKLLHKAASEREEAQEAFRTFIQEHLVAEQVVTADETSKDDRTIFRRWGRSPCGTWEPGNY
jgi:transposase